MITEGNEHKKCRVCGIIKNVNDFHKKKNNRLNCRNECKDCVKILQKKYKTLEFKEKQKKYNKEWRSKNKDYEKNEKRKKYRNEWKKLNKDKISKQSLEYVKNNKDRLREIDKPKRILRRIKKLEDPLFKVMESVRNNIRRSIKTKGFKKNIETEKILGCSYAEFKNHLEHQFEDWMCYDNYGKYNGEFNYGWDIDHIVPISTAKNEEDVIKLNHYTNLKPLCSKINRDVKKNKIDYNIKKNY